MEVSEKIKDRSAVVCVVGVGYVGFPLAEAFSEHLNVIGYDLNGKKVEELNNKIKNNNNLIFTSNPAEIKKADFILIAVPTPVTESKEPDLFCVKSSVETVGHNLKKGAVVVLESTVYPGVTEDLVKPILEKSSGMKCGVDFKLGYSPERINPGDEAHGIGNITKIVSGMDEETTVVLSELYDLVTTVFKAKDIKIAEAAKVIENIQRDLNIALMKWNFNVYYPGAGVGGHCLPVDGHQSRASGGRTHVCPAGHTWICEKAEEPGYHSKVITACRAVNDYMPLHVFELLVDALNECERAVKGSKVVVLGFSYKENVGEAEKDVYEALEGADAMVMMTAHREFREIDMRRAKEKMRTPILIDGRRVFEPKGVRGLGFVYRGVGAGNYIRSLFLQSGAPIEPHATSQ